MQILHIIENDNLFGLADSNNIEIVECVYDKIKSLKNGNYFVVKDKMAGILDKNGKIIFYPQANRLYFIKEIDIYYYRSDEKKVYFTFINDSVYYLSVDRIIYDKKAQVIIVWKNDKLKLYNNDFTQIQLDYEQVILSEFTHHNNRIFFGKNKGMWGAFRIKRPRKHNLELVVMLEEVYSNLEEALTALKNAKKNNINKRRRKSLSSRLSEVIFQKLKNANGNGMEREIIYESLKDEFPMIKTELERQLYIDRLLTKMNKKGIVECQGQMVILTTQE